MEEQLISSVTAKLAKEKGFKVSNIGQWYEGEELYRANMEEDDLYVNGDFSEAISGIDESMYSAPTQSLLAKWLREIHNISIKIDDYITNEKIRFDYNVSPLGSQEDNSSGSYITYEEAFEVALQEALKQIP